MTAVSTHFGSSSIGRAWRPVFSQAILGQCATAAFSYETLEFRPFRVEGIIALKYSKRAAKLMVLSGITVLLIPAHPGGWVSHPPNPIVDAAG
jgi:hypothetical protein